MSYRSLDASRIVETSDRLRARVAERFPDKGLTKVAAELAGVARAAAASVQKVQRPILGLRLSIAALLLGIATSVALAAVQLPLKTRKLREGNLSEVIQTTEASIASIVFLGAAVAYLVSLEGRIKRGRCLRYLHELRALAHVVDMHQLTKDPDRLIRGDIAPNTPSSPRPELDAFLLGRYLDYCSEMMSLISKIAALYAQASVDPGVLQSVDDLERLTTGLSRKMWQKLMLLERLAPHAEPLSAHAFPSDAAAAELTADGTPPAAPAG